MDVAVIGCGHVADVHLKVYKSMKNVNVVGACDLNLELAKDTARKFRLKAVFRCMHMIYLCASNNYAHKRKIFRKMLRGCALV
jgi:predicted dehydrogenase